MAQAMCSRGYRLLLPVDNAYYYSITKIEAAWTAVDNSHGSTSAPLLLDLVQAA